MAFDALTSSRPPARPRVGAVSARLFLAFVLALAPFAARALDAGTRESVVQALAAADEGQWAWASRMAGASGEPAFVDYVRWREFKDPASGADFAALRGFIEAHEDWPGLYRLQRNLESVLDGTVPPLERIAFFSRRAPLGRQGRVRLAEALLAVRARDKAAGLARESWIGDDFSATEERFFLGLFKDELRPEDHIARVDRLLWENKVQGARDMLDRIDEAHRRLALARIALQSSAPGVDAAIRRVPARLRRDPGLEIDRLEWRKRKGLEGGVREALMAPPERLGRPEAWWYYRAYYTRDLIDAHRFDEAYAMVRRHGQADGLSAAEANFLEGWLALRFMNEPTAALAAFTRLYVNVTSPISRARGAYWAGRAARTLGDEKAARRWFEEAARHPTTFYGQLATDLLGRTLRLPRVDVPPALPAASKLPMAPMGRLAGLLCAVGAAKEAEPFLERLLLEGYAAGEVMALASGCEEARLLVELGKAGVQAGILHPVWSYPLPFNDSFAEVAGDRPRRALLTAVARQESHFDRKAESGAGALGLMQLMPRTAAAVAKTIGVAYAPSRLTVDPTYNLALGAGYLASLAERYNGTLALMAAAYNAGPMRVARWIETSRDPRGLDVDGLVDWIELIPFRETRNYVQRVIEGFRVYEVLLDPNREVQPLDEGFERVPRPLPRPQARFLVPRPRPREILG